MGKQGPCYHCGVTSTPLWRNGPPEKPVLCNACGSRWRTKGTLANYTPLHARAETDDSEEQKASRVKNISLNKNKEVKLLKRKQNHDYAAFGGFAPDYNQGFRKFMDEDTSNRSSSGSAGSNLESCGYFGGTDASAHFGGTDASDLTGPVPSVVWDATVPSKKRTCAGRSKPSSVEKLTKDLCTILHQQKSYFSTSSEDDLLFESEAPMVSVEIGHGSILIRHPSSIAREEESEASSLSVDNKQCLMNEAYSYCGAIPMHSDCSGVNSSQGVEVRNAAGKVIQQEQIQRDKSQLERLQVLGNHDSPLCSIDLNQLNFKCDRKCPERTGKYWFSINNKLKDVVNYEEFTRNLTNQEQQQLLKYLPVVDTAELLDSLKNMFNSSQFKENLTYFQQLLGEGVFDTSLSEAKPEDCKTLKRLALSNLSKSKWVEHYYFLKKCKNKAGKSIALESAGMASSNVTKFKRLHDNQNQNFQELKTTMRSPKRVIVKSGGDGKEAVEDGSCFSPRNLFASPRDGSTLMLDSLNFMDENSDQDLLLEVPSHSSFPQAELLDPTLSYGAQASNSSNSVKSHITHP